MNELIDCLHSVYKVFLSMKEYWFMNSKLQSERHLQFTAVILLQQSHGFVVLIIPCYHAVKLKKLISTTEPVVHALWYSNISSMHHECIHQCTINALITASSMHRASCNTSSMHSLYQMHQFRSFSSSFHHQCIVSASINASPINVFISVFIIASSRQSINASSMLR